eukprot:gnl/MRDRNA2_/MRDRNA2_174619_c0_seq1.p1 gnl/MRDRNA2_/MRDRNA2_174619_c0~~gnl/MRDRNA2_/MRDRNA2_174619_c0_seq1.p1  ORF type:complete len:442 (+),score=71.18 gnl/MRDRNA2_/MRDRNA2_174619_c0_seq1:170-1327(+)
MSQAVGSHVSDWDRQIAFALNETFNCTTYLEYIFVSRDRIREELTYIRANFTAQHEVLKAQGPVAEQPLTWVMTYASKAASLLSAHLHIHGVLSATRRGCLSEHLQLLFLMSLRRIKGLLTNQLRTLWLVFQGTSERFLTAAEEWLTEVVDLFDTDMRTIESVLIGWVPNETAVIDHSPYAADGSLSTIEILRRDAFEEWDTKKPLLRAMLRHVFPRDSQVADFCAGSGYNAVWFNETGLLTAFAFDGSENIGLITKNAVGHVALRSRFTLWRSFDYVFCLTAQEELHGAESWAAALRNLDAHATQGLVVSCGSAIQRSEIVGWVAQHAPGFKFQESLTHTVSTAAGDAACVFTKGTAPAVGEVAYVAPTQGGSQSQLEAPRMPE